MSRRLGSWLVGVLMAIVIAAAVVPAYAQVVVRVGPRHRRYYHHHHRHYYRHGHRYYR